MHDTSYAPPPYVPIASHSSVGTGLGHHHTAEVVPMNRIAMRRIWEELPPSSLFPENTLEKPNLGEGIHSVVQNWNYIAYTKVADVSMAVFYLLFIPISAFFGLMKGMMVIFLAGARMLADAFVIPATEAFWIAFQPAVILFSVGIRAIFALPFRSCFQNVFYCGGHARREILRINASEDV
eukprot:TRINITY_DN3332_c0_g1_i1.p1 TRINITY_DN3332_c0_g1~~TRINITY_DN3332_c0_g1_i1.p1  ORF type:complete len:181 (+),score=33.69 TRINITY_DN3332_c0_g1_i1:49-591(+)